MYAIFNIIYGLPLVRNEEETPKYSEALQELVDAEKEGSGFLRYYSGSGDDTPAAFGVEIGEFDECCAYVPREVLRTDVTEEQKAQYWTLFDALPLELRQELSRICEHGIEPRVFALRSTS